MHLIYRLKITSHFKKVLTNASQPPLQTFSKYFYIKKKMLLSISAITVTAGKKPAFTNFTIGLNNSTMVALSNFVA